LFRSIASCADKDTSDGRASVLREAMLPSGSADGRSSDQGRLGMSKALEFAILDSITSGLENPDAPRATIVASRLAGDSSLLRLIPDHAISMAGTLRLAVDDIPRMREEIVNMPDEDGATPLHYACACGDAHAVRMLLQHKANRDARTKDGRTPLDVCSNRVVRRVLFPLSDAIAAACRAEGDSGSLGLLDRTSRLESLLHGTESMRSGGMAAGYDSTLGGSTRSGFRGDGTRIEDGPGGFEAMATVHMLIATGEEVNSGAGVRVRTALH